MGRIASRSPVGSLVAETPGMSKCPVASFVGRARLFSHPFWWGSFGAAGAVFLLAPARRAEFGPAHPEAPNEPHRPMRTQPCGLALKEGGSPFPAWLCSI